ncbi:MAG: gamma-glutamyl-gamma-aminobutyrate hydrolase family protein [Deinococcales bacterium]
MKPRIGITVSSSKDGSLQRAWSGTALAYSSAIVAVGGVPVMLPSIVGTAGEQLAHLQGVLFSGGVDPDPELWGADHESGLGEVDPLRDAFELELYAATRAANKPMLGICRGFQLLNVAEGGSLHQHIPSANGLWVDHRQNALPPSLGHRVRVVAGTKLSAAYKVETLRVNSYHHQGVKDLAPGLSVAAYAPDGLIEAIEGELLLAVQWHPELLFEKYPEHLAPFWALMSMLESKPV